MGEAGGCVLSFINARVPRSGRGWPLLGPPWESAGTGFPDTALWLQTVTPLDWSSSDHRGKEEPLPWF